MTLEEQKADLWKSVAELAEKMGKSGVLAIAIACKTGSKVSLCGLSLGWTGEKIFPPPVVNATYENLTRRGLMVYVPDNMFEDILIHFVMARMTLGSYDDWRLAALHPAAEVYRSLQLPATLFALMLKCLRPAVVRIDGELDTKKIQPGNAATGLTYRLHTSFN